MKKYEVTGNYGTVLMTNRKDAIQALVLVGCYHDIPIVQECVERALDKSGFYEVFPIAIKEVSA